MVVANPVPRAGRCHPGESFAERLQPLRCEEDWAPVEQRVATSGSTIGDEGLLLECLQELFLLIEGFPILFKRIHFSAPGWFAWSRISFQFLRATGDALDSGRAIFLRDFLLVLSFFLGCWKFLPLKTFEQTCLEANTLLF